MQDLLIIHFKVHGLTQQCVDVQYYFMVMASSDYDVSTS
jgi:hypothetical protein